jgi:hypothetical protein
MHRPVVDGLSEIIASAGLGERQFEPHGDLEVLASGGLLRQDAVVAKEPQMVE